MSNLVGNVFDSSVKADASGNVEISGDLTVNGTTTTIATTNSVISDKLIELANGTSGTPSGDAGVVIERGSSNNVFIGWDESEDKVTVATGTFTGASTGDLSLTDAALKTGAITSSGVVTATGFTIGSAAITQTELEILDGATLSTAELNKLDGSTAGTVVASKAVTVDTNKDITGFRNVTLTGELDAGSLDISGDADIDGTLEADAITVAGTALNTVIAGVTVTNATNAVTATNITVADESSDTTCFPIFATAASGDLAPKSGTNLTFNSSSGTLGATEFSGGGSAITGLDASNIGSGTVNAARMAAAQTAITSVLNTNLVVGRDADNQLKFGTNDEITFRVAGADGVVMKASGEIEAASLDISGDVDVDGTLEADAITVNGSALAASATTDTPNATNIGSGPLAAARMAPSHTAITSIVNTSLEIGRDADNRIKFGSDNQIIFEVDGGDNVIFKTSGEIEATSLDISGDVDIDGTLEADAITLNGSALVASATTDTTNASNIGSGTLAAARMAADQTAIGSIKNTALVVGRDNDNLIDFATQDNDIRFRVNGADLFSFTGGSSLPTMSAFAVTGNDSNGKTLSLQGGLGTGTGVPGTVEILSGIPTQSGNNAHTSTPVAIFASEGPTHNFGGVTNLVNDESVGEKVFFGTGATTKGKLYYLTTSGAWAEAQANDVAKSAALLAVACGGDGSGNGPDAATHGMLIRGFIDNASNLTGTFDEGIPIYIDDQHSGKMTVTRPASAGSDVVRIGGYATNTPNVIYFNPESTFIEL